MKNNGKQVEDCTAPANDRGIQRVLFGEGVDCTAPLNDRSIQHPQPSTLYSTIERPGYTPVGIRSTTGRRLYSTFKRPEYTTPNRPPPLYSTPKQPGYTTVEGFRSCRRNDGGDTTVEEGG